MAERNEPQMNADERGYESDKILSALICVHRRQKNTFPPSCARKKKPEPENASD
jgi:hypothetical protein